MEQFKLENSDAIILLAIIYASEFGKQGVTVSQVIRSFDFIEHAIVSYDELKGALSRLSSNNYISEPDYLQFLPSNDSANKFVTYKKQIRN